MSGFGFSGKVISHLASKQGRNVSISDLLKSFVYEKNKNLKGKKRDSRGRPNRDDELRQLIDVLVLSGLLKKEKNTVKIREPFRVQGKISLSRKGDAFVNLETGAEIFIYRENLGGAMQGDVAEILPRSLGKRGKLEGEVTRVVKRGRNAYRWKFISEAGNYLLGHILDMNGSEEILAAIEWKGLERDHKSELKKGRVAIVSIGIQKHAPVSEAVFHALESESAYEADLERILMKYNLSQKYPDLGIELPKSVDEKSVGDWGQRTDLRELFTVTIDGATAKDFDDAVSFSEENGRPVLWVHIADVSYYAKKGSKLDKEAEHRSTSVYLGDRVIPMLPFVLSENYCSLMAGVNRLAFTAEIHFDLSGKIDFAKFYRSIIRVDRRCTYEEAEAEIELGDPDNFFFRMMALARKIKYIRMTSGRVDLDLKENSLKFQNREVLGIDQKKRLSSNILIEEFMLSANTAVAEFLRKKKIPSLYRVHEAMEEEKLETLNAFLKLYGVNYRLKSQSYQHIMEAQDEMRGHPSEKVFNYFLLRSFMQAYYSGETSGHWGLGMKDYCHFTSPIRRYPDLVCHRALWSTLVGEKAYSESEIETLGRHCSTTERKAVDAERDYFKLKACRFYLEKGIKETGGTITGIRPSLVYLELDDTGVEAVIEAIHFTDEGELVLPNDFSFVSKKYSRSFFLGQHFDLRIDSIDLEEMRIYTSPVWKNKVSKPTS